MIAIEKGIPMPASQAGRHRLYPWNEMEVGDSFLMPVTRGQTALNQCQKASARYGRKFSVRKVEGGYRVWRVA